MCTAIKAFIAAVVTFFSAFVCVVIGFALDHDELFILGVFILFPMFIMTLFWFKEEFLNVWNDPWF